MSNLRGGEQFYAAIAEAPGGRFSLKCFVLSTNADTQKLHTKAIEANVYQFTSREEAAAVARVCANQEGFGAEDILWV